MVAAAFHQKHTLNVSISVEVLNAPKIKAIITFFLRFRNREKTESKKEVDLMMKSTFGKHLLKLRQNSRMTRSQLAALLDVSDNTIKNWEYERCQPRHRIATALKISDMFEVSTDYVIGEETDEVPDNRGFLVYAICDDKYLERLSLQLIPLYYYFKRETRYRPIPYEKMTAHNLRRGSDFEMALKQVLSNDERICISKESIRSMIPMLDSPESYDFVLLAIKYRLICEKKQKEEKRDNISAVK